MVSWIKRIAQREIKFQPNLDFWAVQWYRISTRGRFFALQDAKIPWGFENFFTCEVVE
jgi:hypothetical protein